MPHTNRAVAFLVSALFARFNMTGRFIVTGYFIVTLPPTNL
ncbi:exported hypothetical protein [Vibrio coralliirubri]|nr:exported hypothetical protein [Vibrio coralliirubri]